MNFRSGDQVEWRSSFSDRIYRGVIEGFLGKDGVMALCTDGTSRGSRPVSVRRLHRQGMLSRQAGRAA